jgi:hypothetical protein
MPVLKKWASESVPKDLGVRLFSAEISEANGATQLPCGVTIAKNGDATCYLGRYDCGNWLG